MEPDAQQMVRRFLFLLYGGHIARACRRRNGISKRHWRENRT